MDKRFQWTEFYMELASALLPYKNNRSDLIAKLKTIFADAGMNFPFKERGKEVYEDICPFTVFGSFNKGITNANRIALLKQFAKQFSIKAAVPTEFDGIPVVMNLSAWFFAYKENRGEHDIDNLWDLLEKAIAYSDEASTDNKNAFIAAYDTVTKQKMIKWNITMGLYWARPYTFINLDSTNRAFITDVDNMPHYFTTIFSDINKGLPNGRNYLFMCEQAKNALNQKEYEYHSFPELSYYAWKSNQSGKTEETTTTTVDSNIKETNYWIYSPGDNASMWDEFYKFSIMGIGWDDVTDLKGFSSKEEIKEYMKKVYDPSYSYKNNAHCLWQFANEIKVGDVIFVKKGMHKIIGKGIVTSDYIYDTSRSTYKHIRKVDWQNKGEWEHPGQAVMKTLTNISAYPDYVQKLLALFAEDISEEVSEQKEIKYPLYSKDDFLNEVYMDEDTYNTLEYYRKEHPEIRASASQIPWDTDDDYREMLPVMQSDIMLKSGDKTLVIDAKYYAHTTQSQYNTNTLHSGNLYQIFTYVKNLDTSNSGNVAGMLLYAKTDEIVLPNNDYKMGGNQISVKTLDLDCEFAEIKRQLDDIVQRYFDCS